MHVFHYIPWAQFISLHHLLISYFTGLEFVTYLGKELFAVIISEVTIIALAWSWQ